MSEVSDAGALRVTYAHQITPKRQAWLFKLDDVGVMPLGTATICAGNGGEGKSTFALYTAALLTCGELPGDFLGKPQTVIYFGPEDDWATVTVPRLTAAGADLRRVAQVQAETTIDAVTLQRELRFPLDMGLLRQAVEETGARMIILDPAPSMMGTADMNKVQDVRRAYEPLMALAQRHELGVVMINHFGKGAGSVSHKLSGSHAWRDLTRSFLAFATDEDTGERVITQDKSNYGTGSTSWKFVLESVDVPVEDGVTSVGRVRFLGESDVSVGDIINRGADDEADDEDRNAAQGFLLDYLRGCEGWEAKAAAVIKAGLAEGFSKDEIKNARKRSKAPRITSAKSGYGAGWVWQIDPDEADTDTADPAEGVTKVSKVSAFADATPSTPSRVEVTPSTPCPNHGTAYQIGGCYTCDAIHGDHWAA